MTTDQEVEALLGPAAHAVPAVSSPRVTPFSRGDDYAMGGAYEGASRFDRDLALWAPPVNSADGDILPDKPLADARVEDTLRNDAYVQGGARLHQDNIVGSIFLLNAKPATKVLGLDEKWEQEFQEEVETKFTLHAESPDNWLDASRKMTLTGQVRLAIGIYCARGEVLSAVEWLKEPGRTFSTALQFVDIDRLSNPNLQMDTPLLRGGVTQNRYGAAQGYNIRMAHPTDWMNPDAYTWKYVPARKPWGRLQMIHLFEQSRPDQSRGISEMVAALKEMRITKRFRDIVLQNAVVNATYAASIESELPSEAAFAALGGGKVDDIGSAINAYASAYLAQINRYAGGSKNMHLDGVKIPHLYPGTKLQLRGAGQGGPLGTDFEQSLLRYIAAALNVSYEQLSRDYTNTNYSSARAAMNETWKFMQSRKRMVADRYASIVYRLWLEEAINKGTLETLKGRSVPSWYEGQNADAYSACEWIGASRGQIDELKETQAAVLRLLFNLTTQEDELARLGKDWRKINAQRQREIRDQNTREIQPQASSAAAVSGPPSSGKQPANTSARALADLVELIGVEAEEQ